MLTNVFDPWLVTVSQLVEPVAFADSDRAKRASYKKYGNQRRDSAKSRSHENARVCVRERLTEMTVVVDWSDPTMCRYVCQIWRVVRASSRGRCALSGASIETGEFVYRPIALRPSPSNANAMLSTVQVEEALRRARDDGLGAACHVTARRMALKNSEMRAIDGDSPTFGQPHRSNR